MLQPSYFNEEHKMFRDTVKRFVEKELAPHADEWEAAEDFPVEIFKLFGGQGYLGIRYDPKYGGSGLDFWYTAILCEELVGSGMIGLPVDILVQCELATAVIHSVGTVEQKQEFLAPAIRGEKIVALGITEPDTGSDVASIRTSAKRDGDHYIINGAKTFISNGTRADFITLAVRTGEKGHRGVSLIIFPTDTKGFQVARKLEKTGAKTSQTAELSFEDCRVPAKNLLGKEGDGFRYIMRHFQGERLVLACFANALMQRAYDLAVQYGHERKVFGKPILAYQVWKHRMADVLTKIHAARQLTYHACDLLNRGMKEADNIVSMAKLFSTEMARPVVQECYQMFGGYAFMEEYPIARLFRDTAAFTIGAGTSEIMREIIAKESEL